MQMCSLNYVPFPPSVSYASLVFYVSYVCYVFYVSYVSYVSHISDVSHVLTKWVVLYIYLWPQVYYIFV